jgi:putative transposase
VLEKLAVVNMVRSAHGTIDKPGRNVRQKSGLNRAILDQGWHAFRVLLDYKLRERGGRLIEVPAAFTSQTCSVCGVIDAASRVSQSRFVCAYCGNTTNADENAAINILRRADSPALPVEASRRRAREAGTRRRDA